MRLPSIQTFLSNKSSIVCGVAMVCNGKILLVKEEDDSYSIPKGKRDKGESNIKAAQRELKEECSVYIPQSHLLLSKKEILYTDRMSLFYYYIVHTTKEVKNSPDNEIVWSGYVSIKEARDLLPGYQKPIIQELLK